jgi:hypothetical protein
VTLLGVAEISQKITEQGGGALMVLVALASFSMAAKLV